MLCRSRDLEEEAHSGWRSIHAGGRLLGRAPAITTSEVVSLQGSQHRVGTLWPAMAYVWRSLLEKGISILKVNIRFWQTPGAMVARPPQS